MNASRHYQHLFCRLTMHHTWQLKYTEDGDRYRQCRRCGKDKYTPRPGPGDWAASV